MLIDIVFQNVWSCDSCQNGARLTNKKGHLYFTTMNPTLHVKEEKLLSSLSLQSVDIEKDHMYLLRHDGTVRIHIFQKRCSLNCTEQEECYVINGRSKCVNYNRNSKKKSNRPHHLCHFGYYGRNCQHYVNESLGIFHEQTKNLTILGRFSVMDIVAGSNMLYALSVAYELHILSLNNSGGHGKKILGGMHKYSLGYNHHSHKLYIAECNVLHFRSILHVRDYKGKLLYMMHTIGFEGDTTCYFDIQVINRTLFLVAKSENYKSNVYDYGKPYIVYGSETSPFRTLIHLKRMNMITIIGHEWIEWGICNTFNFVGIVKIQNRVFATEIIISKYVENEKKLKTKLINPKRQHDDKQQLKTISSTCYTDGTLIRLACNMLKTCYVTLKNRVMAKFSVTEGSWPQKVYYKPGEIFVLFTNYTVVTFTLSRKSSNNNNCVPGFTGTKCTKNIDECHEINRCNKSNTVKCTDGVNAYTCKCKSSYAGKTCDSKNECLSKPCQNGAFCYNKNPKRYICACSTGYYGLHCEKRQSYTFKNFSLEASHALPILSRDFILAGAYTVMRSPRMLLTLTYINKTAIIKRIRALATPIRFAMYSQTQKSIISLRAYRKGIYLYNVGTLETLAFIGVENANKLTSIVEHNSIFLATAVIKNEYNKYMYKILYCKISLKKQYFHVISELRIKSSTNLNLILTSAHITEMNDQKHGQIYFIKTIGGTRSYQMMEIIINAKHFIDKLSETHLLTKKGYRTKYFYNYMYKTTTVISWRFRFNVKWAAIAMHHFQKILVRKGKVEIIPITSFRMKTNEDLFITGNLLFAVNLSKIRIYKLK